MSNWKWTATHVFTPDVGGKDLVLLFKVEDLDECDAVADLDGLRRVVDRPTDQSDLFVVAEEIFYKALFIWHRIQIWKKVNTSRFWSQIGG